MAEDVLVSFDGTDGYQPQAGLVADSNGNLYGATFGGGANNYGTVFELANTGSTSAPTYGAMPTTLLTFSGSTGGGVYGSLIFDAAGDLYGATENGGNITNATPYGSGTVFAVINVGTVSAPKYSSTPATVAAFDGSDGYLPQAGLVADANGNLFGTTVGGGANREGTVFEVVNNGTTSAPSYNGTPFALVSFSGTDGQSPAAGLIADAKGDLYGTTSRGGDANGDGTVFEVVNTGTTKAPVYSATPQVLVAFDGTDGSAPEAALVADGNGNLFGTTFGGGAFGGGTVFELANTGTASAPAYSATPTVLVSFSGLDGLSPQDGGLIVDAKGDLFGTTQQGGSLYSSSGNGDGTVFELANLGTTTAPVYGATPTTLVSFTGPNGAYPDANLIVDANGDLYSTTNQGGANGGAVGDGTVFEITDSGFVVCFRTGTRLRAVRGGTITDVAVENLVVGDRAVTVSGDTRPVVWIGHRDIDCRGLPDLLPVRVAAHAFGDNLPTRDLMLSPGHPVLVGADTDNEGGHLVPIMCLVNGTTVSRQTVVQVTYWHVELDAHDILLAENLPAESYLDWGDRAFFSEGSDHRLANPDFVVPGLSGRCRPVALDGPMVEAARQKLDAAFATRLAAACAWPAAWDWSLGLEVTRPLVDTVNLEGKLDLGAGATAKVTGKMMLDQGDADEGATRQSRESHEWRWPSAAGSPDRATTIPPPHAVP